MLFLDVKKTKQKTKKNKKNKTNKTQPIKEEGLLRQPIACYEIAKRTYHFVMTYVGNRTIKYDPC